MPITNRTFTVFMYMNLLKQATEWSFAMKDMANKKVKYLHNIAHQSMLNLLNEIEADLNKRSSLDGYDYMEQYWEDSEVFSKLFETIKNAPVEKKQEIYLIVKAYVDGELNIIESEASQTKDSSN